MKVVFLDIDGVLNRFRTSNRPTTAQIEPDLVANFNRIIEETRAKIVLSSSWRHLILNGHMDIHGFQRLLQSHGVRGHLIGHTRDEADDEPRWRQITDWLSGNEHDEYCVIDDDWLAFGPLHGAYVTGGSGLSSYEASVAISILGKTEEKSGH